MTTTVVGYQRLIEQHRLAAMPLTQLAQIDTRVKGREIRTQDGVDQLLFESRYHPIH